MSWSALRHRARQMGFDVAYRSRHVEGGGYQPDFATPPAEEGPWICVGSYEQTAGVWVQPITEAARELAPERVSAAIAGCDPFIALVHDYHHDYSEDFIGVSLHWRRALENPEHGLMPA